MENWDSIQKALAERRHDVPSDQYFSGILSEFHSRQRNVAFVQKSLVDRLIESIKDLWFFQPARLIQGAAFSLIVLFFTLNGLHESWSEGSETLTNWYKGDASSENQSSVQEQFMISSAMDQLGAASLNRPAELASISTVAAGVDRTQYVMNSTPATYDAVVAF
ncbi:MAG: hypothetical protein V4507_07310 [Verrucomicrobiota bacterium]